MNESKMVEALKQLRIALAGMLLSMAKITTEEGLVILYDEQTPLTEGASVWIESESGERLPYSGEFTYEGRRYICVDGMVKEVEEKQKPTDADVVDVASVREELKQFRAQLKELHGILSRLELSRAKPVEETPTPPIKRTIWD